MKKILIVLGVAAFALVIPRTFALAAIVYDAVPGTLAGNYPSQPFQAQQTNEFGDYVHLAGTDRVLTTVAVTMSDWALASTPANIAFCTTSGNCDSTGFFWPITVNIYSNSLTGDIPNTLLDTKTVLTHIPWRPVGDPSCPDTGYGVGFAWRFDATTCYNGYAFNATFDLSDLDLTLPNDVIVGFVYNTQTYGPAPTGVDGPYNSLNIAVPSGNVATIGIDDSNNQVFWNTETVGYYSNGICTGNTFCRDTVWTPYGTVAMQINAITPTVTVTIDKFVDGVMATAGNANSSAFPMSATWSAVNIGSGSGSYDLDADGFNGIPVPYQAITSPMTVGADYSTYEVTGGLVVGATCADGKPFALVGYTTGDTLALAQVAPKSTTAPSFTGLTSDKYVIVWNQTCQDPPPLFCPAGTTPSSLIETVTVLANASTATLSRNLLASGTDYLLKAYGTADAGDGITFDARYSFRIPTSAMWTDAVSTYEGLGTQLLDLRLNGGTPWGSLDYAHEYWSLVPGNGALASFLIDDAYYPNNTGELKVDIYSCMPNIAYVTGGGNIKTSKAVMWTFGGNVWRDGSGNLVGNFELSDKVNKVNYHFNQFTYVSSTNNSISFTASGTMQGKTKTLVTGVTFTITDNGEPGKGDTIFVTGGSPSIPIPSTTISGGNFQVFISN